VKSRESVQCSIVGTTFSVDSSMHTAHRSNWRCSDFILEEFQFSWVGWVEHCGTRHKLDKCCRS